MRKEKKQPFLRLFLCVFFMGLINVSVPNPAFAVQNLKQDFLRIVRAKMESSQNPGLSSKYFSVGDPDKLLAGVEQYVIGVAVDRDYLAHFKLMNYMKSFRWVQHPGRALTQPRYEDAGWGDIAFTPQEERYSGWIILASPPDSDGDARITSFHEAIHAYHFYIRSTADHDDYGAPEHITNNYANLIISLRVLDKRLAEIREKIKNGKDYESDLQSLRKAITEREKLYKEFANSKFKEVLNNIGGRADWDGYRKAVNQAVADAVAGVSQSSTSFKEQLEALKKRLARVEDAIPGFKELKAKYDEEELTIKLHIAAVQKQNAKNEVSEAFEINGRIILTENAIPEILGEAKSNTASVEEKTADLNSTYSDYAVAAKEASDAADRVCDYESRAASQPPPPVDEIAGWINESDGLITKASASVQGADKKIAKRIKSLDTGIAELRTKLKHLEVASSRGAILADFDRLKEIKGTLDDAEKDIERAKEIAAGLSAALRLLTQTRNSLGSEITELGKEAGRFAQAIRGKDQQLETDVAQLEARIKAAGNDVWVELPSSPPEVPELGPQFHSIRTTSENTVKRRAVFEREFGHVSSAIADGQKAIADAEGAVVSGAFATRNALPNIQRAEQCYASLKKAEQPAMVQTSREVNALKARLDAAERELNAVIKTNDDINRLIKEMEKHAEDADKKLNLIGEIDAELERQNIDIKVDEQQLNDLIKGVEDRVSKLRLAYNMLARSTEEISRVRAGVCEYASKAGSPPLPSAGEIETRRAELREQLEKAALALKIASNEVIAQREALDHKMASLKAGLEKLPVVIKRLSEKRQIVTDGAKEFQEAVSLKTQIDAKPKPLELRKKAGEIVRELDEIRSALRVLSEGVGATLQKDQIDEMVKHIEALKERKMPLGRMPYLSSLQDRYKFYSSYYSIAVKSRIAAIKELLTRGEKALAEAEGAKTAGEFAVRNAPGTLEQARACDASLGEAIKKAQSVDSDAARAAIGSCRFDNARNLIDKLQDSPQKGELEKMLDTAKKGDDKAKALFAEAQGQYKAGDFGGTITTLKKAIAETPCAGYKDFLKEKIAKAKRAKDLKAELEGLVNKANGQYKSCKYDEALQTLNDALSKAQAAKHLESIRSKIETVKQRKAHEKTTMTLFKEADGLYREGQYQGALEKLEAARKHTKCGRYKDKLGEKIAKVKGKLEPGREGEVVREQGIEPVPAEEEAKSLYAVFGGYLAKPRQYPGWWNNLPPANADRHTRERFYRQVKNRKTQWIDRLTLSDTVIAREEKAIVIQFTGDALKTYSKEYFQSGRAFSLPVRTSQGSGAFLLRVENVYRSLEEVRSAYPKFKPKKNNIFGGLEVNNDRGNTTRSEVGPLTEGWSEDNKQKSLVFTKIGLHVGLAVAESAVP